MKTEIKDLNYWKNNCEEDYIKTPISVLRYVSELEKQCDMHVVSRSTKVKLNKPFEIEDYNGKYVIETYFFIDKDNLWEKEINFKRIE